MSPVHPTDLRSLVAALRALAEPIAARVDVDVVAIEVVGASGASGRVLRVSLDKAGGATITDCTRFSRIFSPALDVADLVATTYTLEVSTPGIERPVQRLVDFERFVGCTCRIKTWDMDSRRRLKSVLTGVEGDEVLVTVDGVPRRYHIDDIERANLVLSLDEYARLGEGLHPLAPASPPVAAPKAARAPRLSKDDGGHSPPVAKKPRPSRTLKESP